MSNRRLKRTAEWLNFEGFAADAAGPTWALRVNRRPTRFPSAQQARERIVMGDVLVDARHQEANEGILCGS
jgi:hypothetical protein